MEPRKIAGPAYWWRIVVLVAGTIALAGGLLHVAGVPLVWIIVGGAGFLVMLGLAALTQSTPIVESAKERSSQRPFLERLGEPDPELPKFISMLRMVVPMSIAFFGMGVFVIRIMAEALFGEYSWVTSSLEATALWVFRCTPALVIASYGGLWGLHGYVTIKLRRSSAS